MNKNEQHAQESLFDEQVTNGDQKQEDQSQKVLEEASLSQESSEPETSPESQESEKERAGTILKRERETQGISLEIVHEATKIPMDALRAIEEGYKVRTLVPFYYKGFVKMYAEYLGMDTTEVIDDYKKEKLPEHIKQDIDIEEFQMPGWIARFFTRRRKRQIVVIFGILFALFLFVKAIGFIGKLFSRPSDKENAEQSQAVEKKTEKPQAVKAGDQKNVVQQKKSSESKPRVKVTDPKPVERAQVKVQPVVASKPVSEPAVVTSGATDVVPASLLSKAITLTVRAKQKSWLHVKADGNVVFQSTLSTGTIETWAADDRIEISGKNIDQLEFELNGKMIGTLGRRDRNAKRVIITQNGLSVEN